MPKKEIEESKVLNLQFDKRGGLIPAIAQDFETGDILMIGSVNEEAWQKSVDLGFATFWSTSRNELWTKGETSGDLLKIEEILVDCDQDAVIYKVKRLGAGACHTKNQQHEARRSCFYRKYDVKNKVLNNIEE